MKLLKIWKNFICEMLNKDIMKFAYFNKKLRIKLDNV